MGCHDLLSLYVEIIVLWRKPYFNLTEWRLTNKLILLLKNISLYLTLFRQFSTAGKNVRVKLLYNYNFEKWSIFENVPLTFSHMFSVYSYMFVCCTNIIVFLLFGFGDVGNGHRKSTTCNRCFHLFDFRVRHDDGHRPFDLGHCDWFQLFDRLRHSVEKRVHWVHVFQSETIKNFK